MELHNCEEIYISLYLDMYHDIAAQLCISRKNHDRDCGEIRDRYRAEGLPFLTVALPRLGKALDALLGRGTSFNVLGFEKRPDTQIPKLFGDLFERVMDSSGNELPDCEPTVVRALRQLTLFAYKLETPYDESLEETLLTTFVKVDKELPVFIDRDPVLDIAAQLCATVFGCFDHLDIVPRHGGGSVATGEDPAEKHVFKRLYTAIERVYPFTEYFVWSLSQVADEYRVIQGLQVLPSGTAKVVLVPKDSRGPRIISCEPLEYQWIQQGLGNAIRANLEKHRLTRGFVNFTDQQINRSLAQIGSSTGQWVTLDMKEASDRVSCALVVRIFERLPLLRDALIATRSTRTKLPNGTIVELRKFAPMGSNLCFPVEAFVFWALAVASLVHKESERIGPVAAHTVARQRRELIRRFASSVFVYGDDIIVGREDYATLLSYFPTVGLLFNEAKCCVTGSFRESCGMDAFKGVDVTPLRLRKQWSHSYMDTEFLSSYVAFSNAAYLAGYHRMALRVESLIERMYGTFPRFNVVEQRTDPSVVALHSSLIHQCSPRDLARAVRSRLNSLLKGNQNEYGPAQKVGSQFVWRRYDSHVYSQPRDVKTRFNRSLHRFEVRAWSSEALTVESNPDCWGMILRRFSSPSEHDDPGVFALPRRSRLRLGWTPVV